MPAVLEHAPAGLALRAVVDRVLVVVDALERVAADVARLAEAVVDAVDLRVLRAAVAEVEAAGQLLVDRSGEPLDLLA